MTWKTDIYLKDILTCFGISCGMVSMAFILQGRFDLAPFFFFLGIIFDSLDGVVARLTKTSNDFGRVFDTIGDLGLYSYVPAFFVYTGLQGHYPLLSVVLLIIPVIIGTWRVARNEVLKA